MIPYSPPTSTINIPAIDLAGSFGPNPMRRTAVAWEVHKACRYTGFFCVRNHGIPQQTLDFQLDWSRRFFALPIERKLALHMDLSRGPIGYEPMKLQTLDLGSPPDLKEAFQFRNGPVSEDERGPINRWPDGLPGFREQMDRYYEHVAALGRHLMQMLALSLDLPETHFETERVGYGAAVRLLHYPPHPVDAALNQLGAGAHTDWGAITMLLQDDKGGLEIKTASGEWIGATPIPGTLVVNLGDMVRRWTNDIYHSSLHRVLNNRSGTDRYSVASFFGPGVDYRVECVPTCRPAKGEPLYPPCTVGEHTREMFERTYGRKASATLA